MLNHPLSYNRRSKSRHLAHVSEYSKAPRIQSAYEIPVSHFTTRQNVACAITALALSLSSECIALRNSNLARR